MKVFPLKLQNKFEELDIDDCSNNDTVDTGCTTPSNGASPTERGANKACLIPCQINYLVTICYVKKFISKLKERTSWMKPKHYFVRTIKPKSEIMINVGLRTMDTHRMVDVKALLDSGATGMFIDKKFVEGNGITTRLLDKPIRVYNVDGMLNQEGSITHEVTLMMSHKGHKEKAVFKVCNLGKSTVIIGYTWLQKHNPSINWKTGNIKFTKCPQECNVATKKRKQKKASAFKYKASVEEVDDIIEEEEIECEEDEETENDIYLRVIEFIQKTEIKIEKKTDEEMVPPQFHAYLNIFKKAPSEHMPVTAGTAWCNPRKHQKKYMFCFSLPVFL